VQDYDETFPYCRFHGSDANRGSRTYVWRNAILPYLKNLDVLACPSNPNSRAVPGQYGPQTKPKPGDNAEGWEMEPTQRMPISYSLNQCAITWLPSDNKNPVPPPPLRVSQLTRPSDTIAISEVLWQNADMGPEWFWLYCNGLMAHPAGKVGNFVFFDGHAKSKKWMATLYPFTQNNWEPGEPSPDPNNRQFHGTPPCTYTAPPGPDDPKFTQPQCQSW
jgi:prepilin-type processing-associated H-X9-DG protein